MIEKTRFKRALAAVLKEAGFTMKGQSFFLDGQDTIVVLNLQKSDFDEQYYVNVGIWLKALGSTAFPAENKCHILARLTSLFTSEFNVIERACHLTSATEEDLVRFVGIAKTIVVPFCASCLHIDGLKERHGSGQFRKALVLKEAKQLLQYLFTPGAPPAGRTSRSHAARRRGRVVLAMER